MFALLGGKLPRAEVRLHTALALVKIKFAQGQNARELPTPLAVCLDRNCLLELWPHCRTVLKKGGHSAWSGGRVV